MVIAKGKSKINTYWLKEVASSASGNNSLVQTAVTRVTGTTGNAVVGTGTPVVQSQVKIDRQWNVDVLSRLLKQVVARRKCSDKLPKAVTLSFEDAVKQAHSQSTLLEEMVDIIALSKFDAKSAKR